MRGFQRLIVASCLGCCLPAMLAGRVTAAPPESNVEVYFSPRGGAIEAILKEIGGATVEHPGPGV